MRVGGQCWRQRPLCMQPEIVAKEISNIVNAKKVVQFSDFYSQRDQNTLIIKNFYTKKNIDLRIMNFDMIQVQCDAKVISTDKNLNHYFGLAGMYSKHVSQQNERNPDKEKFEH